MIDSKIYRGIEYVQLDELPSTQREKISQTLNSELLIKIMIDGKVINDCLQYKDYSYWYNSVFKKHAPASAVTQSAEVDFEPKFVLK